MCIRDRASAIGAQRVLSASGTYGPVSTSGNAVTASGTLTINGSVGSKTGNVAVGATARDIATTVNGLTADTGVTARAKTDGLSLIHI